MSRICLSGRKQLVVVRTGFELGKRRFCKLVEVKQLKVWGARVKGLRCPGSESCWNLHWMVLRWNAGLL